ncbi:hypothetical protein GpartN1_g4121.t1 [Galdieria partita]|uniref:Enoyl reductase (ER) domain-containing protein n=1 Tax=Galdieria partita TaxID=83374 RepID=A0A9C7PXL4_9RHOD|nr:hypothetical protein GpartN1_g4121.t1 [Galdieria partita]
MKVKAAVLQEMGRPTPYAKSKPIIIEELELAPPHDDEVLVKLLYAGLCHSDLSVINASRPRPTPMALGHEAVGRIQQVGKNVDNVQVGDIVSCVFVPSCGTCDSCRTGRPATCTTGAKANGAGLLLCGQSHLSRTTQVNKPNDSKMIHHLLGVAAFSTYSVMNKNSVVKIDPSIPPQYAAVFGCAVITGVGAVVNTAKIEFGASVAIVGLGGVGFCALLGALAAGASNIIVVDLEQSKLDLAKKLGASHGVLSTKDISLDNLIQSVKQLTQQGRGVDYAFEMAGSGPTLKVAYGITRPGGTTVTAGLPHPETQFSVSQVTITAEERTLKGSYLGSCVPTRDIPRYVQLFKEGRLPVDKLISGIITLDQINEGFDQLDQGKVIRLLLKLHDDEE